MRKCGGSHRRSGTTRRNSSDSTLVFDTVIKYIEGTETATGLKVRVDLKRGGNETGERVSNEKMRSLKIEPHEICPAWSYTIQPHPEPSSNNQFIYC
jgi:hypothetical protein